MVCFIVGFVYAWLYLPGAGKGDPTGGKVGKAHLYLGTIVMGLAGMQVWMKGGGGGESVCGGGRSCGGFSLSAVLCNLLHILTLMTALPFGS